MLLVRFLIIVLCFACAVHFAAAQNRVFDHFGPKDGLVTSQVLCMTKDRQGYLWLGTEFGLAQYDAHTFRYFRHNYKDERTLSSNYVHDIQCDHHNRIWVSSTRNLDIFDIATGKVLRYKDDIFKANTPWISGLYYDKSGDTLWITTSEGVFYNAGKTISVKKKNFPGVKGLVHDMMKQGQHQYVFAGDKAIYVHNTRTGKTRSWYHAYHKDTVDDGFLCLHADGDSVIWAGSWVYGLLRIDVRTGDTQTYTFQDPLKGQNAVLDIQKLHPTDHELFLATTVGVQVFNTQSRSFFSYESNNIYDSKGIDGAGFCFMADNSSLWIGTYKGLYKYDLLKNFIKNIPLHIDNLSGNPQPQDLCFEKSKSGKDSIVWVSFPYESIHRYDLIRLKCIPFPAPLAGLLENKKTGPYSMLIGSDRVFWISTEKHNLIVYDFTENKIVKPDFTDPFKGPVLHMMEDRKSRVWLGTRDTWFLAEKKDGKICISEQKEIFKKIKAEHPGMEVVPYIFSLDSKNNIWFLGKDKATNMRLPLYFDFTNNTLQLFTVNKYPELQRLGWIDGVMVNKGDEVLISGFSDFGWMIKNGSGFEFKSYQSTKKINTNHSKSMAEDYQGNLIMSSDFGISYLNKNNALLSTFSYYNTSIGTAVQPGIFISPNTQRIYLGQKRSLDYFDPSTLKIPAPGIIRLADISISNYTDANNIQDGDVVRLRHDQNQIHLSVTNLFFTNAEFSKYFYRWSDEEEWVENPDNQFHFNNLSPGKYYLQIKSSNAFGVEGKDIFRVSFVISPPFYKAWWFYLLLSLSGIGIVYVLFWYRDQQRLKLEKLRHHIARDLHDDLGSSLSYIRILSESEARKTTNNISFKNISEKTAEIMNNMSEIIWSINPVYDSFNNVVTRLQDFAIDTLEPLDIELKFDIETLPDKYKLSPENRRQYYLIFKEAINNAAKYSKAKKVVLSIHLEKKNICTILEDDGIGFDSLLIRKGNGLKNMKSRADFLHGELYITTSDHGTKIQLDMKG